MEPKKLCRNASFIISGCLFTFFGLLGVGLASYVREIGGGYDAYVFPLFILTCIGGFFIVGFIFWGISYFIIKLLGEDKGECILD